MEAKTQLDNFSKAINELWQSLIETFHKIASIIKEIIKIYVSVYNAFSPYKLNSKVLHLATKGKKLRTRKKNLHRIQKAFSMV